MWGLGDFCFLLCILAVGDSCLPCPDKNSSTSVRREPNIGVRRSRTTMGDRCTPEPTMFSVPGGTPSAGIAKGSPLAGFLGTLSPQKEFPWGSGGRSAPACGRRAAGPHGRGAAAGGPKASFQKTTSSHPPASASARRLKGPLGREPSIFPSAPFDGKPVVLCEELHITVQASYNPQFGKKQPHRRDGAVFFCYNFD